MVEVVTVPSLCLGVPCTAVSVAVGTGAHSCACAAPLSWLQARTSTFLVSVFVRSSF